jgi:formylmethanofuran dehydrogenase subunit C
MKASGRPREKGTRPERTGQRPQNPFQEFRAYQPLFKPDLPLDRIIESTEGVMDQIRHGYEKLLEEEAKELVWMVQYNTIIKAYEVAEKYVKEIEYSSEDIEDFCFALENTQKIPYLIPGPAGLYISALCNYAKEAEIVLKLCELKTEINLLGFRLAKGKRLVIEGDAGDFTGIGLEGGDMVVEGSAKNWTGAGMRSGKILVKKNIGLHTGEWMMGGEIYVGGRVRGLGNIVEGKIFEREKLVYPGKVRYPNMYY